MNLRRRGLLPFRAREIRSIQIDGCVASPYRLIIAGHRRKSNAGKNSEAEILREIDHAGKVRRALKRYLLLGDW